MGGGGSVDVGFGAFDGGPRWRSTPYYGAARQFLRCDMLRCRYGVLTFVVWCRMMSACLAKRGQTIALNFISKGRRRDDRPGWVESEVRSRLGSGVRGQICEEGGSEEGAGEEGGQARGEEGREEEGQEVRPLPEFVAWSGDRPHRWDRSKPLALAGEQLWPEGVADEQAVARQADGLAVVVK